MAAKTLLASGVLYTERRKPYIEELKVAELWKTVAPFMQFSRKMETQHPNDPDYRMFEHRSVFINQYFQQNDASPNTWASSGEPGDTVTWDAIDAITGLPATIDSSYVGHVGDFFQDDGSGNPGTYLGQGFISAIVSTTGITFLSMGNPGDADFYIADTLDDCHFIVTHRLSGEGTEAPEANSDELEYVHNTCSIIETPVEVTGTLYEAALRGYSNELSRLRLEKDKEQNVAINRMYYFGMRTSGIRGVAHGAGSGTDTGAIAHITDAATKTVRSGMGAIPVLRRYGRTSGDQQNNFSVNQATYKYDHFVDDGRKSFQYVPTEGIKYGFCGGGFMAFFSKVSNAGFLGNSGMKVQLSDSFVDKIGFNVMDLVVPTGGIIRMVYDPCLRGPYDGTMVLIDPDNIGAAVYRKNRLAFNVKTDNDYDGVKDNWRTDEGPILNLVETHSLWTLT